MKLAVGVLTRNLFEHERLDLFKRTVNSLAPQAAKHGELYIVSNGSTDGTGEYVEKLGGLAIDDPISTFGHGANVTIGVCAASGAEVVVFSNDDMEWNPDALDAIAEMWPEASADIALIGGLLEEDFPWSTPRARIEIAGHVGLVRDTVPGAAWSLRAADWPKIRPLPEFPGGGDVATCERLVKKGYRLCAFDLSTHLGEENSTWGNNSAVFGKPLDRAAWGLPASLPAQ